MLVRNGEANIVLGSDLVEIKSVHFSIHLLQLVINDAVLSQRNVKDILAKCLRLSIHFNHYALSCTQFKAIQTEQGLEPLLLVNDVPTRWNSAYLLLNRLLKLKRAVQRYMTEHDELPNITSNEWQIIKNLLSILKPLYRLTVDMSSELCTLPTVASNICTLVRFLSKTENKDHGVKITKDELVTSLRQRFSSENEIHITKDRFYILTTIMDPRFKLQFFSWNHITMKSMAIRGTDELQEARFECQYIK